MFFLAIETSCDDTSIAIFNNEKLISLKTKSQSIHQKYGGIIPEVASRQHSIDIDHLISFALEDAKLKLSSLEAIVVTQGPGLINSLQVGMIVAKTLASIYKIDLYLINHLEGHLYSPFINKNLNLIPEKALVLLVSGGHTILFEKNNFDYKLISTTRDDAVGEAFDKTARILNLGYPGGKIIDQIHQQFSKNDFPKITIPLENSLEFSYSGLKSKILSLNKEALFSKEAIAYAFMETAIMQLVNKTKKVLNAENYQNLIVVGGVSANSYLRKQLINLKNVQTFFPEMNFTTDNAAMIGIAFYYKYINNKITKSELNSDSDPKLKFL